MNKINLIKPVLRLYKPDETRKLCSFQVLENKTGMLFVDVKKDSVMNDHRFIIELKNKSGKLLGYEQYSHFNNNDNMVGLYINIKPEYRQKHYFLGEIIRLTRIIQMLENKVKAFSISSKDSAIYFHSKYKFEPSVTSFKDRDRLLKDVREDRNPAFKDLAQKANEMTIKIQNTLSAEKQRFLCKKANELFSKYIKRAMSQNSIKQHKFNWTMDMTLTYRNVKENKEYFNALFEKHGIDYKI